MNEIHWFWFAALRAPVTIASSPVLFMMRADSSARVMPMSSGVAWFRK
jgi:hypothetical protein